MILGLVGRLSEETDKSRLYDVLEGQSTGETKISVFESVEGDAFCWIADGPKGQMALLEAAREQVEETSVVDSVFVASLKEPEAVAKTWDLTYRQLGFTGRQTILGLEPAQLKPEREIAGFLVVPKDGTPPTSLTEVIPLGSLSHFRPIASTDRELYLVEIRSGAIPFVDPRSFQPRSALGDKVPVLAQLRDLLSRLQDSSGLVEGAFLCTEGIPRS